MKARVTTVQVQPARIEEAVSIYRDSVVAAAKAQQGYRATYMLVDPASGKGMAITLWDTAEDMQANESSGYYQEQLAKFGPLLTAAPTRETFDVSVQA